IDEWERWFATVGVTSAQARGPVFDSSGNLAEVAILGQDIGILPIRMFASEREGGQLVQPFKDEIALGRYWLTSLKSKPQTAGMKVFQQWLVQGCRESAPGGAGL